MKQKYLILVNANVYPYSDHPHANTAIVIWEDKILAVGNQDKILEEFRGNSTIEDMQGRTILPGMTDAHIHLQHYSLNLKKINCETPTLEECLSRVEEIAKSTPPGTWILGHGWNQNNWHSGFGTAADLDRVAPNHPVYLTAKSLHAGWLNSLGMKLAMITNDTPDPPDGQLGREKDGSINGILFESAMQLANHAIPDPTKESVKEAISNALPSLWQVGITTVHDFDQRTCFSALQSLQQDGELKLRVIKSIPLEDLQHAVSVGLQTGFGNDFLRIGSVKAFSDGALGPQTAAMLSPYENDPKNRGILMLDAEELYEKGRLASKNGLSMAVHAIGDRANHEVLEAFSQLRKFEASLPNSPKNRLRHRIEHVQVVHPDDFNQFSELDIIASMQPIHATSDMEMADRYWGTRAAFSYAWKKQVKQNVILAFGSDAPVESPNPFWGVHAAVTRQRQDGAPNSQGWYPEERLTVLETLNAYTIGPAFAAGMEDRLGKISPGYLADLIVLDTNPFSCPHDQLYKIKPSATMVGGEWVWRLS